jgi:hypothetical protein
MSETHLNEMKIFYLLLSLLKQIHMYLIRQMVNTRP